MKYILFIFLLIILCVHCFSENIIDIGLDICGVNANTLLYDTTFVCPSILLYNKFGDFGIGVKTKMYYGLCYFELYYSSYVCLLIKICDTRYIFGYGITNFANEPDNSQNQEYQIHTNTFQTITIGTTSPLFKLGAYHLNFTTTIDIVFSPVTPYYSSLYFDPMIIYKIFEVFDYIRGNLGFSYSLPM